MKSTYYTLILMLLFSCNLLGQQYIEDHNKKESSITPIAYKATIPEPSSYMVTKNITGNEIPDSILLEINKHRRHNRNNLWKVNEEIEILIYKPD